MSAKIEFIKTPAAPKPPVASTKTGVRTTDVSILLYWPLILDFFINPSIGPKLVVLFCFFFFFVQSHDWSQCMSLIGRKDYHDTHADHLVMAGFNAMPLLAKVKL